MSNGALHTNRDLYLFVTRLRDVPAYEGCALEDYLRTLWRLGSQHASITELPLSRFAALLESAFRGPSPAFDPAWREIVEPDAPISSGYAGWERTILHQIVDLRDMDEAGTLRNKLSYLGVAAPRGGDWYNLDPLTYLECATAFTFRGNRRGDGRIMVAPQKLDPPTYQIAQVDWNQFSIFLRAGQQYE
jgi:hypothetical protein